MPKDTKIVSIRLPRTTYHQLKKTAEREKRSVSNLVKIFLDDGVKHREELLAAEGKKF